MDLSKIDPARLPFIPAGVPPNGTLSNLVNPPSRVHEIKTVIYVTVSFMFVPLVLRLYTRARITRNFGADDLLAILAALCVGGYCGATFKMLDRAPGKHMWDLSIATVIISLNKSAFYITSIWTFTMAAIFVRASLLYLYLRLFKPVGRTVIVIWGGIVFIIVGYIALGIITTIFYLQSADPALVERGGSTRLTTAVMTVSSGQGVLGSVSDIYILLIPLRLVGLMHLPLGRKLGVCAIFLTGLLAVGCSLACSVVRFQVRTSKDPFWDMITIWNLIIVEINAGIITSCLPVVFILCKHISKKERYIRVVQAIRSHFSSLQDSQEKDQTTTQGKKWGKIQLSIPKPTMTGLRSFIRRGDGTQQLPSNCTDSTMDLDAIEDSYHVQLKASR